MFGLDRAAAAAAAGGADAWWCYVSLAPNISTTSNQAMLHAVFRFTGASLICLQAGFNKPQIMLG